jgi:hypothetical protein
MPKGVTSGSAGCGARIPISGDPRSAHVDASKLRHNLFDTIHHFIAGLVRRRFMTRTRRMPRRIMSQYESK